MKINCISKMYLSRLIQFFTRQNNQFFAKKIAFSQII